jgi:hypothetical protein
VDSFVTQAVWAITVLSFGFWCLVLTILIVLAYTSDLDERWGKRPRVQRDYAPGKFKGRGN